MAWGSPKSPKSGTKARALYKEGRRGLGAAPYDHAGDEPPDDGDEERAYDDPDEGSFFITPARTEAICDEIRNGVAIPVAAGALGIPDSLWASWLKTAREHKAKHFKPGFGVNESPYLYFLNEVNKAKNRCEADLSRATHMAAKLDWKAAAWKLERMASKRYHLATMIDITAQSGSREDIQKLPTAVLLQLAKNEAPKALPASTTEEPVDAELDDA